jgi:diguanylate cyclase (GGDEF)-like protein
MTEAALQIAPLSASREHILCVDDEEGILSALRQQLAARFGHECEIEVAQSANDALEFIAELDKDGEQLAVVIADQIMPGMKGVELLEEVHRRSPATTKILLTGQAGLDAVVAAINRAGLNRYIPKPWEEQDLRLAVENLLRQYRLDRQNRKLVDDLASRNTELERLNHNLEQAVGRRTRELAEANARLAQLAVTDGLTGLYNHRHFHERLALEVERSGRSGMPLALLMIDVDHFKRYNDKEGHPAGDEVLRQLARVLADGRRVNDIVARYGGEEFAIVLVDTPKLTAYQIAEKLRDRVRGQPFGLTISTGVAVFAEDAADAEGLVRAADAALYRAKAGGRDQVVLT